MSQELLNKIAEMLEPVSDSRNWGFIDDDGDFRWSDLYTQAFDTKYNNQHPQKIAEKIIELIRESS